MNECLFGKTGSLTENITQGLMQIQWPTVFITEDYNYHTILFMIGVWLMEESFLNIEG